MRSLIVSVTLAVVVAIGGGRADAYPQFQLSRDQTCTSCHISPAGGGLLNENGTNVAETISKFGTNPEFMYGGIKTPGWLALGGDLRGMWGYLQAPQRYLWGFPMQGDIYAAATKGSVSAHVTVGLRPAQEGNLAATTVGAREHYVMWHSKPGESSGAFLRLGHFMPVFGLRWVEHPLYVRRFGGTPMFSETYGAAAEYVSGRFELHATGFIKDPLIDPVRHGNGGALYGELRVGERTLIGMGGMAELETSDRYVIRGALTAKRYLAGPDLLLQGELQVINPHVTDYGYRQIASQVMATYSGPGGIMLDVGWGHYDSNLRIAELDRDAFDLNVHWFATSHIELMIVSRLELIALGKGGPTGAYSFLQLHYRL